MLLILHRNVVVFFKRHLNFFYFLLNFKFDWKINQNIYDLPRHFIADADRDKFQYPSANASAIADCRGEFRTLYLVKFWIHLQFLFYLHYTVWISWPTKMHLTGTVNQKQLWVFPWKFKGNFRFKSTIR